MKKGLVVASFALRSPAEEPNPCNIRIGKAAFRVIERESGQVVIVSQWEVTEWLKPHWGSLIARDVGLKPDGSYLGAEDIWQAAAEELRARGITEVIIVGQLLVRIKIAGLAKHDGFKVLRRHVGWIGFDFSRKNLQWWTRDPLRMMWYVFLQLAFKYRGFDGRQYPKGIPID